MPSYAPASSRPITISASTEAQTYALFALAIALTAIGFYVGALYATTIYGAGAHIFLLIAQLGLILTAPLWMDKTPLNYLLFAGLPLLSGIAIAPYISAVIIGYSNGPSIIINALAATAFMTAAAAVFARTTAWNLGVMGRTLFFALLGMIGLTIVQLFMPSLRSGPFELMLSGFGVLLFSLFTAYDLQRIQQLGRAGANPFMLALSLYLDVFNLFLSLLRFMTSLSGERR